MKNSRNLGHLLKIVSASFGLIVFAITSVIPYFIEVTKTVQIILFVVGFGVFMVSGFAVAIWYVVTSFRKESQRVYGQAGLKDIAQRMSFSYSEKMELPFLRQFDDWLGLSVGPSSHTLNGWSTNVLTGKVNGRNIVISDQNYRVATGNQRSGTRVTTDTIVGIELPEANLPIFCLYPQKFSIWDSLTKTDIDFPIYPTFSAKYRLFGRNEEQIRQFFEERVVRYYEQTLPFSTTVCGGKYLIIYGSGSINPTEIPARIEHLERLANLFLKKNGFPIAN